MKMVEDISMMLTILITPIILVSAIIILYFYRKKIIESEDYYESDEKPDYTQQTKTDEKPYYTQQTKTDETVEKQQQEFQLKKYIINTLNKGFSKERIKEYLMSRNYPEEEIDEIFEEIYRK